VRALPVLCLAALPALAQWGRDLDEGMARQMRDAIEPPLAAIVKAPAAERPALIDAFVAEHAAERIEALKRYRNPELVPLFLALLDHPDWHVRHRALLVLEAIGDPGTVLDRALPLLTHPQRRLREKAALTCLRLWDGRPPPPRFASLLDAEEDFHVRQCLKALQRRMEGSLKPEVVHEERTEKLPNGLLLVPYVSGMRGGKGKAREGRGRAPDADRWVTPLLGQGEEEVAGVNLQPFANLRQEGKVYHTGVDVGACLEGAGFYAAAAGVVRLVHTGSDMGTLIVVEHALPDGGTVNAVYMHGGPVVYVAAGERVEAGQLLTTMGLGFSEENGGHFAHLHYGLYPGAFDLAHNYGYKPVAQGLDDWLDPARFLPHWIARTKPLLPHLRPLEVTLQGAVKQAEAGRWGEAWTAAVKVRDRAEPGSERHVDAVYLAGLLEAVPAAGLARARWLRDAGYPGDAARELEETARQCRGLPGTDELKAELEGWQKDPLFKKALKGEGRMETTRARARRAKGPEQARALWRKLLEEYGDTCLRPRLEEELK